MNTERPAARDLPRFDRTFFGARETFTRIGAGAIGGKAAGLVFIKDILEARLHPGVHSPIRIRVPTLTVIATEVFDAFVTMNGLEEIASSSEPDSRIAHAFLQGELPVEVVGDLRALVGEVHSPLAIRSSSLLEDALHRPFAGVYSTKMTPNNQPDADTRYRRLVEAVKLVWASTYFRDAKDYIRATDRETAQEKMAVMVQEVVGLRHDDRFYPDISGVARSYDFYPTGSGSPSDGVVNLALGLGKTIVDGGLCWTYWPSRPRATPPFASARDLLANTQTEFWAVNMGRPPAFDPIRETEYLVAASLADAERDGTLQHVASTYDAGSDRLSPGTYGTGPRALNFAPLLVLEQIRINDLIRDLLRICEDAVGDPVEIEFAMNLGTAGGEVEFGFLQIRPMVVCDDETEVPTGDMASADAVVSSESIMGNGFRDDILDVVYVKPSSFEPRHTRAVAAQVAGINNRLVSERRPFVLIGFGRWGSADPWLGIPVNWGQICGAGAIVEATLPEMNVDPSQGSHFFHNISSFRVGYFSVHHASAHRIRWDWLESQPVVEETEFVRHVRTASPLIVKLDGKNRRGVILAPAPGKHPRGDS